MKQLMFIWLSLVASVVNAQQAEPTCDDYVVALTQLETQVLLGDKIMSGMRFHLKGIEREIDLQSDGTTEPDEHLLSQFRTLYNDLVHKYNEINRMRNDAYDKWQVIYKIYTNSCIYKSPSSQQVQTQT